MDWYFLWDDESLDSIDAEHPQYGLLQDISSLYLSGLLRQVESIRARGRDQFELRSFQHEVPTEVRQQIDREIYASIQKADELKTRLDSQYREGRQAIVATMQERVNYLVAESD